MTLRDRTTTRQQRCDGYVVVTLAVLLTVLLAFAGIAIDIGLLYSARTSAQRAADAAALAAAFTFITQPTSPQPATAEEHARRIATSNSVLGASNQESEVGVDVDIANQRVAVVVERAEATFLMRFLAASADIAVTAVAEASESAVVAACVKPWFVPNTILSDQAPCDACSSGELLIAGGAVTAFVLERLGTQIRIKPQTPDNALAPGQFFPIQLDGPGGSHYRAAISSCAANNVACGELYQVKTGNMVGPTIQGVNNLIGNPPRDSYVGVGEYAWPDGTIRDTSGALIATAIWDVCSMDGFCPGNQFPSGVNAYVAIVGYALIFLEGVQGDDVVGRLINAFTCGASGGADTTAAGSFVVPVRLVRTP